MNANKYIYQFQIKEHHLDTFGHVNHAVYLNLFEEARWEFINENNMGLDHILKEKMGPIILELTIKFKQEIKNRQWVKIESSCKEIKKKLIMVLEQNLYIVHNDSPTSPLACTATFSMGIMDLSERRLVPIPPYWLKALGVSSP